MKFYGKIEQPDDKTSTKSTKGSHLPDAKDNSYLDGDLYTVVSGGVDVTYVKAATGWVRILVDGSDIDAGSY